MSILVTIKPTILKDNAAMSRLMGVLERKLGVTLPDIVQAIFTIAAAVRGNQQVGKETNIRMGVTNGKVWTEVLP